MKFAQFYGILHYTKPILITDFLKFQFDTFLSPNEFILCTYLKSVL